MAIGIKDFLADSTKTDAPLRIPSVGKNVPKGNYIGLALVPKNLLPDIGSATTYTPIGGGSAAAISETNLIAMLADAAVNGQAWVFGNGCINGKRSKPKEDKEKVVYGSRRIARPLSDLTEIYDFTFKYQYLNRPFFNQLRNNFIEYDAYVFTNASVEQIRYDDNEPVFDNIGDEVSGDNSSEVTGGFMMTIGGEGQVKVFLGTFEKALQQSMFRYSFGIPAVTGTGIASTLSGTVITKTSGGSGTITNAVTNTVATGVVTYSLFNPSGTVPTGLTIDTVTGVVTVGAGVTAGTYNLKVAAENKTGVMGEYGFKLVAA